MGWVESFWLSLQTVTTVWKTVAISCFQGVKQVLKNLLRGLQLRVISGTELMSSYGGASSSLLGDHIVLVGDC